MIKRVIEQIFQAHAADSLRKTLAEVERAASGKLHNESLADYVTRLASFKYDAEHRIEQLADYAALTDEWHTVSLENGREPDELMGDYMVRIWTALDVAQRFADDQKEKLQAANMRIDYLLCEPADSVQTLRDLEATANDNGRKPEEAVREFMTRTVAELTHAQTAIRMIQNRAYIYNCKKDEPVIDFLSRMNGTLNELRQRVRECDDAAEKTGCGRTEETAEFIARLAADLKELKQTITDKNATISTLRGTHADDIARIDKLSAQLAEIEAEATECGRDEGESVPKFMSRMVIDLGDERASSMAMSKAWAASKEDVAREHERGNRINAEYEASISNIMAAASKLGRADYESPDAFMQRQDSAITGLKSDVLQVYAVSDTLGRKSSESIPDFMKRQDEEITGLRKSIDAVNADKTPNESLKYLYDCADKLGRGTTQTISDFMMWQAANVVEQTGRTNRVGERLDRVRQELQDKAQQLLKMQGWHEENLEKIRELTAKHTVKTLAEIFDTAKKHGRRSDETVSEFITRQHRLAADRQTALDRASETIATLTSDLTSAIVDKALAGNGAKEINRLSALVAELQVELDDAKGKYGGIMAQLGNETPLQLIERMQRLAQDQRASTIPHDERAMLVSESADLRKRLQESQKAHAKTEHELRGKLRAALATVENQSAAIAEAKQATEKYTAVVEAAAKLKDWASTIRHKVLVAMVHTKAMAEYDNIMKELDGKAGTDGR